MRDPYIHAEKTPIARDLAQRQARIAAKAWSDTHPGNPGRTVIKCVAFREKVAGICLLIGFFLFPEGLITHHAGTAITALLAVLGSAYYLRERRKVVMTKRDKRIRELARMTKSVLARMHKQNGGLMPLADYLKWTKDELVNAVLEDEGYIA